MNKFFISVLMLTSLPAFGAEKIPVFWECVLFNDTVDCDELKDAFKDTHGGFRLSPKNEARLNIRLGRNMLPDSSEYVVRLTIAGKPQREYKQEFEDHLSADEKKEKVFGFLGRSLEGVKTELGYVEPPKKESPIYVEPMIVVNGGKQPGTTTVNAGSYISANYSTPDYRVMVDGGGNYNRQVQEENAFSPRIENTEIRMGAGGGGAYSITEHVSVGAFGGHSRTQTRIVTEAEIGIPDSARNHTATRTSGRVGVEWIQHPFIDDSKNGNFSIRGYVQAEHHDYIDPQSFERREETFARPSVDASYSHQFKTFNLAGTLSGYRSVGREKELQGVALTGKANFKIHDRVIVEPNFTLDYTENRVRTTAGTNYSFIALTGMQDDDNLTFSYGLSIRVPLGNSRLSSRERRWKD